MQLADLRSALVRRWYLVTLGLVASGAVCGLALSLIGPTYESRASVVLIPGSGTIVEGGNPLLYLGGLAQARDVVIRSLQSDAVREPLSARNPDAAVDLAADATSSGPLIAVTVSADSEVAAEAALVDVLAAVPAEVDRLQDAVDAPDRARFSALVVAADDEPAVIQKERLRAAAAALAAGLAGTVLLTSALDGLLLARASRRRDDVPAPDGPARTAGHGAAEPAAMEPTAPRVPRAPTSSAQAARVAVRPHR